MVEIPHRARRYGYRVKKRFREDPFSVIVLYSLFFSMIFLIFAFRGLIATVFIKPLGVINPAINSQPTTSENQTDTSANDNGSFILKSNQEYTVQTGDTLSSIAKELDYEVKELAELNNLSAPYDLQVGQKLKLP